MTSQSQSIKTMTIIWLAMIAGLTLFTVVVYVLILPKTEITPVDPTVYYIIAIALASSGMIGSTFMYKIQVRSAAQLVNPVPERLMAHYQTALLLKLSLLEGPGLFSVVVGLLTGQSFFAALTGGILILMAIAKPTEQQFREDFLNGRDL